MRLFVALDLPDDVRERIIQFVADMRPFAPDARWMASASWHITLAFLGERPEAGLPGLKLALAKIQCAEVPIMFRDYGFFPNPQSARVFWAGIEGGSLLETLAHKVSDAAGVGRLIAEYHPHLTLARAGGSRDSGAPTRQAQDRLKKRFARLQSELASVRQLDFGAMIAREFYLYQSRLSDQGSTYEKLERFALSTPHAATERTA